MTGEERRELLLERLRGSDVAISASSFAKEYQVSRQIIVGDVALLRAAGAEVRATTRGYVLENGFTKGYRGQVACQHDPSDTKAELELMVANGAEVVDVIVEHPLYGELKGNLDIKSSQEVGDFMDLVKKEQANLLSNLTGGIHLHTLVTKDESAFTKLKIALKEAGYLYEN